MAASAFRQPHGRPSYVVFLVFHLQRCWPHRHTATSLPAIMWGPYESDLFVLRQRGSKLTDDVDFLTTIF